MADAVPVSVVVVTRNEERNIERCLKSLNGFDDVWLVDSQSTDKTVEIATRMGAQVVQFEWNGQYPKKRQWCLDRLTLAYERVLFIDADEEMTAELRAEITALDWACTGYFVKGAYVVDGRVVQFGMKNNKLCLFDRRYFEFPVVDDLDIEGMGEIEGHYQPVPKRSDVTIGQLKCALLHHAMEDDARWSARHDGYAVWEVEMRARDAYPQEVALWRKALKRVFGALPVRVRAAAAFLHSYIVCFGFLDKARGFKLARSRYDYYQRLSSQ